VAGSFVAAGAGGFDLGRRWFGKGTRMEALIPDVTIRGLDDRQKACRRNARR
jgi:hypothetical protein